MWLICWRIPHQSWRCVEFFIHSTRCNTIPPAEVLHEWKSWRYAEFFICPIYNADVDCTWVVTVFSSSTIRFSDAVTLTEIVTVSRDEHNTLFRSRHSDKSRDNLSPTIIWFSAAVKPTNVTVFSDQHNTVLQWRHSERKKNRDSFSTNTIRFFRCRNFEKIVTVALLA